MNIFVLSTNPKLAARYHCDKHVVKMILETAQILSAASYINKRHREWMYKPTHLGHPCVLWAAKSETNRSWLVDLGLELCAEYTRRYKRAHATYSILRKFRAAIFRSVERPTSWAKAMPDKCKKSTAVASYRTYYKKFKRKIARYNHGPKPYWF